MTVTSIRKFQQGDVIVRSAVIPGDAQPRQGLVLAEGEATGHKHEVLDGEAELLELGGRLFLRVLSGDARVVHAEHKAITLPRGDYEVGYVREYDHLADIGRKQTPPVLADEKDVDVRAVLQWREPVSDAAIRRVRD